MCAAQAGVIPKHPRLYLEAARNREKNAEEMWRNKKSVEEEGGDDVKEGVAEESG